VKTVNLKERQNGRLLWRAGKKHSIDRVFDHFQSVFLCVGQFGFCAGLSMGCLMLMSFLLPATNSGAEKGVI
jgi:hypothetical protein